MIKLDNLKLKPGFNKQDVLNYLSQHIGYLLLDYVYKRKRRYFEQNTRGAGRIYSFLRVSQIQEHANI